MGPSVAYKLGYICGRGPLQGPCPGPYRDGAIGSEDRLGVASDGDGSTLVHWKKKLDTIRNYNGLLQIDFV